MKKRETGKEREVEKTDRLWVFWVYRQETQLAILEIARRAICIIQDYGFTKQFSGISKRLETHFVKNNKTGE